MELEEKRKLLEKAICDLPERQKVALTLCFYEGLSNQEAADIMGVSLGSARTHYERGKRRLRELLEESERFHESRS